VKTLLNSGILRHDPARGTIFFAVLDCAFCLLLSWLLRVGLGRHAPGPLWAWLVFMAAAIAIASAAVYLLLSLTRRQRQALEELNHSLRNSLQVLMYAAQQCDAETAPKAQEAIDHISETLRDVSQRLGALSERELRPTQRVIDKQHSV
jgi:two-component sensor histidine kinase